MTTIPTVGFNVETVTYKNVKFNVWVSIKCFQESIEILQRITLTSFALN